jgi:SAM-dependent methyltransferase
MEKELRTSGRDDLHTKLVAKFGSESKMLFRVVRGATYHQSIQDLVAYTGLSFDEVCQRVALKSGDKGHFVSEFIWENPGTPNELNWFYRANRGYLYGNASRPEWDALSALTPDLHSPVLDYGGGIGQNTIALAERGFRVSYFDISVLQMDFVIFRAHNRGLMVDVIPPFYNRRFNFMDCIPTGFRAVVLQDVLEHIPRYPMVLENLVAKLLPGGVILEYSPFNGKLQGKKMPRHSPVHLREETPLDKVMLGLKMERTDLGKYPSTLWRKAEA